MEGEDFQDTQVPWRRGSGAIKAVTSERGILPPPGGRGPCARECGARKFLNAPADLQEPLKAADVVANASAEDSQLYFPTA